MALVHQPASPPQPLTYEQYMAEGEVNLRYDIIDGVRMVTNPTRRHQRIIRNLVFPLTHYEQSSGRGKMIIAPCDILIRRSPLRTRQPDVCFISNERLAQNGPETDPAPLSPAPELVVEILSPSDTKAVLAGKLVDYISLEVEECWVVNPREQTVEVLRLTPLGAETVATYGAAETLQSAIFPDLSVPAAAIFAE